MRAIGDLAELVIAGMRVVVDSTLPPGTFSMRTAHDRVDLINVGVATGQPIEIEWLQFVLYGPVFAITRWPRMVMLVGFEEDRQ